MALGNTEVRPATTADLDALLRLYVQLDDSNSATSPEAAAVELRAMLDRPGLTLLVAEQAGQVVGTVTLVVVPNLTHNAQPWAQLENMVVDESVRGLGVGNELIERCLALAWAQRCYKVQLQSANQRAGAHRFYEREGLIPSSVGYRRYRAYGES